MSYPSWDLASPDSIEKTVYYFNGQWNNKGTHPASRDGWRRMKIYGIQ
jgi:hypothetical protein